MTGLEKIGATLVFITLRACTAQAPNWHPNADEFMYIVKGTAGGCASGCELQHEACLHFPALHATCCALPLTTPHTACRRQCAGDGLERNVVWNGSLYTSVLKQGDVQVTPQGGLGVAVHQLSMWQAYSLRGQPCMPPSAGLSWWRARKPL